MAFMSRSALVPKIFLKRSVNDIFISFSIKIIGCFRHLVKTTYKYRNNMLFIQKFEDPHHQDGSLNPEATARLLRLHRHRLLQQDGRNARFQDDLHGLLSNEKQLYVSCRRFTFDPNSDVLWINFKNSITPMLDRMKADQGVRDYKIEKVYTDKKATLRARLRIVPIEAVEDFVLEISLEDSLGETAVTIAE